jgi:formate dehydrogenase major subunit
MNTNTRESITGGTSSMDMNRRQFFRVSGAGLAASSLVALGFSPATALAETRHFKLARTTETRNTCPYCSVGCGVIMYSLGDKAKNVSAEIIHIEGDPDHPVNRGTLCPKGAGLLDFVHSPNRLKYPEIREPGSSEWKRVTWEDAMSRLAKMMKADRDANFMTTNANGQVVNRWTTTGMLCASASSNETGYITHKAMRSMGMLVFDNQARV